MWGLLLKYGLPIVGAAAVLFGAYEYGHSTGYTSGHNDGYQTAWNTQQVTINKMVTAENAQAEANNKAISDVESQSFAAAFQNKALQVQLEEKRQTVVKNYVQANPVSSQACGFDVPMVQAINELIQADPSIVAQPVVPAPTQAPVNQGDPK